MKKYLEKMRQKDPHERHREAMRISGVITGVIFVGWISTLGFRLGAPVQKTAEQVGGLPSQMASVFAAFSLKAKGPNTLEVASTTKY